MSHFSAFAAEERALIRGTQITYTPGSSSLQNWLPTTVSSEPEGIWWRYVADIRFTEPFFIDTLNSINHQQRLTCFTQLDALDTLSASITPTAFIFHVSRCGSTLLTQLLASLPQCIVMSEPPALDSFFRQNNSNPHKSEQTLHSLIKALGQQRFADEQKFFIKLDSWHLCHLPLIRQAFPDTPCLFLYRKPNEVLNSHRRQRGPQMIPGWMDATSLHLDPTPLLPADFDGYCVKILESFFKTALQFALSDDLILLNYQQLPSLLFPHLLNFFSIKCTPEELETLKIRSRFHAKNKQTIFTGDSPAGANGADHTLRHVVEPYYHQLDELRSKQHFFHKAENQ